MAILKAGLGQMRTRLDFCTPYQRISVWDYGENCHLKDSLKKGRTIYDHASLQINLICFLATFFKYFFGISQVLPFQDQEEAWWWVLELVLFDLSLFFSTLLLCLLNQLIYL